MLCAPLYIVITAIFIYSRARLLFISPLLPRRHGLHAAIVKALFTQHIGNYDLNNAPTNWRAAQLIHFFFIYFHTLYLPYLPAKLCPLIERINHLHMKWANKKGRPKDSQLNKTWKTGAANVRMKNVETNIYHHHAITKYCCAYKYICICTRRCRGIRRSFLVKSFQFRSQFIN